MRRSCTPSTVQIQAAEPSPRASSYATLNASSTRTSGPPNFFGLSRYHRFAFQKSSMVWRGTMRALPVSMDRLRSSGARARARSSSLSGAYETSAMGVLLLNGRDFDGAPGPRGLVQGIDHGERVQAFGGRRHR